MASSSSSRSRSYDVFPSFSGEDVRKSFLSHLLKALDRKAINIFRDHGIERSRPIAPELLSAIRESRISIVVFSKNYASSTWCLNELVEIHKCFKELDQMLIPVFYDVDPSDVRKQTREFGKGFEETCKSQTANEKQKWIQALVEVANMAGEDSRNWSDEANMIEKIATEISNKLIAPSSNFGNFVGIEAHIKSLNSLFCLESDKVRMVGIVGPSGIGKTTIARALFSQLSSHFHYRAFGAYKRSNPNDYIMKLCWEEEFLSEILDHKDIKISHLGMVEQRLKNKKVFIVLDDVEDLELLKTLVGQISWFGNGSRIIVVTQDRQILKSHEIDLIYEVEFPSEDLAIQMFCRSAFGKNSPPSGFKKLAVEVTKLAGNLPLGLNVLGSSLRGRDKEEWMERLLRLRDVLDRKIEKTLRVSYDVLYDKNDQELFLFIACLFNGEEEDNIKKILGDSANIGLRVLANKSLIRITPPCKTVYMHTLLEKLGREIVRAESIYNPGKRRFLVDPEDIRDVLTENNGTENILGIHLNTSEINEPLSINKKSFKGMCNLQFIKFHKEQWAEKTGDVRLELPQGLVYLPRKLRLLYWDEYPAKYIPCSFSAEYLVELRMEDSKLEKLWEGGTQSLRSLKKMNISESRYLKEIPDLSNATSLEILSLFGCTSLASLPSSIRNLKKLTDLWMARCSKLEFLPTDVDLESLKKLNLYECSRLRSFPRLSRSVSKLYLDTTAVKEVEDSPWIENISGLTELVWNGCPLRCMPSNFHPEHLCTLELLENKLEKLWEGVQSLRNLRRMDLSKSENLKEIPDLSNATNLEYLGVNYCTSLVMLPCSIRNLQRLWKMEMKGCTRLEVLPTGVNLGRLEMLDLSGCSRLRSFPQISTSIRELYLDGTAIEEVPSRIENITKLNLLCMRGCYRLRNISPRVFKLRYLNEADFSDCGGVTSFRDASEVATVAHITGDQLEPEDDFSRISLFEYMNKRYKEDLIMRSLSLNEVRNLFLLHNCFNLDRDAQEHIIQSYSSMPTVLPGGEVPTYFTHRACGSSLIITLPQSSLSQEALLFKACIVVRPLPNPKAVNSSFGVCWCFRGVRGMERVDPLTDLCKRDHLVIFQFDHLADLADFEVKSPPSELDYNDMKIDFFGFASSDYNLKDCPVSFERIKGCGIRLLKAYQSLDGESDVESESSSEPEYN